MGKRLVKPKKLGQFTPVYIDWVDSTVMHGWTFDYGRADIRDHRALGFVVESDRLGVTLTVSYNPRNNGYICPLTIPWESVKNIKVLELKEDGKVS